MDSNNERALTFSQRSGLAEIPPQLKLGEVSQEFRRMTAYYIGLEIERAEHHGYNGSYFEGPWKRVATDLHVLFFALPHSSFNNSSFDLSRKLEGFVNTSRFAALFDLLEFLLRHENVSTTAKNNLINSFRNARTAYRVFDGATIAAIGSDEQAKAFERAIQKAELLGYTAVRKQLVASGTALRNADWAESIRQSIHAVEAMAIVLAPTKNTLGDALHALEKNGHLHAGLRKAFASLYGYSSDEEGVRHALVFDDKAQVDEADALFMLGACASFVSYLISRHHK